MVLGGFLMVLMWFWGDSEGDSRWFKVVLGWF